MNDFAQKHPDVIKAFHLMWDGYPGVATLVHKSREIIAANPTAASIGRKPGEICIKLGKPEEHAGCLAGECLREQKGKSIKKLVGSSERVLLWVPLEGYPEYYLHFSVVVP